MENEVQAPKSKNISKKWLWLVGSIFLLTVVIALSSGGDDSAGDSNSQTQTNNSGYTYVTPENTLERQIEQAIVDKLGGKNNMGKPTVVGVEVDEYNDAELKASNYPASTKVSGVLVKINASENLTTNLQKGTMADEASDVFQATFPLSSEIGDVIVWSQLPVKDQYGNTKDDTALVFAMARPSYEKVNWVSFSHRDLPTLLKTEEKVDDRNGYSELIKF